jgi:uncharacterized protein YjbI with pentapeptide repeats
MANDEHVEMLKKGVAAWNAWRKENRDLLPNLQGAQEQANLSGADLRNADLRKANLSLVNLSGAILGGANLIEADLIGADLRKADLRKAVIFRAYLSKADLSAADLGEANLEEANLHGADLGGANLRGADLGGANLTEATLIGANLRGADLGGANLTEATLIGANLSGAYLYGASLINTDLTDADLTGSRIYGVSAWGVKLDGAKQECLIIAREWQREPPEWSGEDPTTEYEPQITVDNIEVAQFIYLPLHNQKIRDVIDTITSKAVLILGRFTADRKAILDALREELRKRDYLPILFDFDKPASQDLTATISTLAHLARFVIADITDPSSIPYELATVVPTTPVPVQPILLSGSSEFAMFQDLRRRYPWVLTTHCYDSQTQLIADLRACSSIIESISVDLGFPG